ncbi:MAG: YfhO family protein [Deltaproteobacteria bacterium]|nr:YfhO family protein [Deltaproteobacteria bacterium]
MKSFLATSLQDISIPFWCPNYFCGSPFLSDIQSGVFYPLSLIFYFLPFPFSYNIYVVCHFFFAYLFFYLFIRGLGLSTGAALFAGVSYCFGGFIIASVGMLNNLTVAIWLPAILWSFQKASDEGWTTGYFLTALFLSMAILGGEPQLFLMTVGLLFLFGMMRASPWNSHGRSLLKTGLILFGLIALSGLMTAVQLGPTYTDYQYSARLGGLTYQEVTKFSLEWGMLKHLILPLHFDADFATNPDTLSRFFPGKGEMPWLLTIYPGLLIVPLALVGVFHHFSRKFLLWPIIFLLGLTLALGKYTPLYYLFYKVFPFFRFPEKFMFLAGFSLLVMSAYGFDRLMSLLKGRGIPPLLPGTLLILVLVLDLYGAHGNLNPVVRSSFYQYHHPALKPVLEDPGTFRIYVDPKAIPQASVQDTVLNHHIAWQMLLMPNLALLDGLYQAGGKSGLELRYQYLITEILLKPWPERIRFLRLANVKYIFTSQDLAQHHELKDVVEKISPLVYRLKEPLPRAWLVGRVHPLARGTVETLLRPSFDPVSSVYGRPRLARKYKRPFFQNVDDIQYGHGGQIEIEVTAQEPSILLLTESAYPGWRVYVDGSERPCLWLNLLFQGVEVEKGKHHIRFVFRPKGFNLYLAVTFVSLGLFFFVWFCIWRSGKKKDQMLT